MEAVAEKKEAVVIPEDTNHQVVTFLNMEGDQAPLEFSAGAPLSQNNRNYLLKHGCSYRLPERLRKHIAKLGYPKYENLPVPGFPGNVRSVKVGITHRFSLQLVEDPGAVTILEHNKDKVNIDSLPGADTNTAKIPGRQEEGVSFVADDRLKEIEKQNENLSNKMSALIGDYNELSGKFDDISEANIKLSESNKLLQDNLNNKPLANNKVKKQKRKG